MSPGTLDEALLTVEHRNLRSFDFMHVYFFKKLSTPNGMIVMSCSHFPTGIKRKAISWYTRNSRNQKGLT